MQSAARAGDRIQGLRAARDLIYKGDIAREIAEFHQRQASLLTYEDLADFTVLVEAPENHPLPGPGSQQLRSLVPGSLAPEWP